MARVLRAAALVCAITLTTPALAAATLPLFTSHRHDRPPPRGHPHKLRAPGPRHDRHPAGYGASFALDALPETQPTCSTGRYQPQLVWIYIHPPEQSDYRAATEQVRSDLLHAGSLLDGARLRVYCGGVPDVTYDGGARVDQIINWLRERINAYWAKYIVYYDGDDPYGRPGYGQTWPDGRPGAENWNNQPSLSYGPLFAVIYRSGWGKADVLHEIGHLLGAVDTGYYTPAFYPYGEWTPHGTAGSHCFDGLDVMCYPDGTARGEFYTDSYCPVLIPAFDCGHDDYYDPAPAAGSYLADHWNLAHSRFVTVLRRERETERQAVKRTGVNVK